MRFRDYIEPIAIDVAEGTITADKVYDGVHVSMRLGMCHVQTAEVIEVMNVAVRAKDADLSVVEANRDLFEKAPVSGLFLAIVHAGQEAESSEARLFYIDNLGKHAAFSNRVSDDELRKRQG